MCSTSSARTPWVRCRSSTPSRADCAWISALYLFRIVLVTTVEILVRPVDGEASRDGVHKSLFALEDLKRAGDPTHRKKRSKGATKCGSVGIGQALPVRQFPGPSDAQRVKSGAADADSIGGPVANRAPALWNTRGDSVSALGRMVESCRPNGSNVTEPALHLVGDRQERSGSRGRFRPRTLAAASTGAEIIARMARLARGQITIVEVEIADQCSVVAVQHGPAHSPSTDQGTVLRATEVLDLRPNDADGFGPVDPIAQPRATRTRSFSCARAASDRSSYAARTTNPASVSAIVIGT